MASSARELEAIPDVCPSCAVRDVEDPVTGFCLSCAGDAIAEDYVEREAVAIAERRRRWRARTGLRSREMARSRELLRVGERERQRKSRLLARVRPREAPHAGADPLRLAEEVLQHLKAVRGSVSTTSSAVEHLREAEELVRQLAWGPEP